MFDIKRDRLNYGTLLTPPEGYSLNAAVATTYSLDLNSLIAATISLGLNEATDSELTNSKLNVLHAIERVAKKVVIFCEAGQIKTPSAPSDIHLLLEQMISTVALPGKNNSYPSFHPKTWTLEFTAKGKKPKYRFIVLSRNLTTDRSWDVSVALEGEVGSGGKTKVKPLLNFIAYLKKNVASKDPYKESKRQIIKCLLQNLQNVNFQASEDGKPFDKFEIMPLGIGDGEVDMSLDDLFNTKESCNDLMVISPFLSDFTIQTLNETNQLSGGQRILITRRTELPKIVEVSDNFDVYTMKSTIIDGDNNISDGDINYNYQPQDIHAKLYLKRKHSDTYLYLGSMNASERGTGMFSTERRVEQKVRNVELMIKLWTKNMYLNANSMVKEIMGIDDKSNPFERVDLSKIELTNNQQDIHEQLLRRIKAVCRLNLEATVTANVDSYDIEIESKCSNIPEGITLSPLMAVGKETSLAVITKIDGIRLTELSELYNVRAKIGDVQEDKIILIPTKNIPVERDGAIIKNIIPTPQKFIEYVSFILSDDYLDSFFEMMDIENAQNQSKSTYRTPLMSSLYEKMIKVACQDSRKLREIDELIVSINDSSIIPDEFTKLYNTFKKALRIK